MSRPKLSTQISFLEKDADDYLNVIQKVEKGLEAATTIQERQTIEQLIERSYGKHARMLDKIAEMKAKQ